MAQWLVQAWKKSFWTAGHGPRQSIPRSTSVCVFTPPPRPKSWWRHWTDRSVVSHGGDFVPFVWGRLEARLLSSDARAIAPVRWRHLTSSPHVNRVLDLDRSLPRCNDSCFTSSAVHSRSLSDAANTENATSITQPVDLCLFSIAMPCLGPRSSCGRGRPCKDCKRVREKNAKYCKNFRRYNNTALPRCARWLNRALQYVRQTVAILNIGTGGAVLESPDFGLALPVQRRTKKIMTTTNYHHHHHHHHNLSSIFRCCEQN